MHNSVPPDSDLEMRWGEGGGWSSRPLDKRGRSLKKLFLTLRPLVWSKNKGGDRAPPLDPPVQLFDLLCKVQHVTLPVA